MQTLTIRTAAAADVPRFLRLFVAYRRFYHLPPRQQESARFLRARLRRGEALVLLAEAGARRSITGFALIYPTFSSLRLAPAWVLNDLFVAPRYRRHGVARALLTELSARAEASGVAVVSLSTEHGNERARPLYESLGYEQDTAFAHYDLDLQQRSRG
jgi:ribosomal protein S18 acetylase RimI-like enzyme